MAILFFRNALAVIALTLPIAAFADINGSVNLSAGSSFSLDSGSTVTSGGDISWNGTSITTVGSAADADLTTSLPTYSGASTFSQLTSQGALLIQEYATAYASALTNAAITPTLNDILIVHTNGGNYSAVLVTSIAAGAIGLQYYTVESGTSTGTGTGPSAPAVSAIVNNYSSIPAGFPSYGIAPASLFVIYGTNLSGPASSLQSSGGAGLQTTVNQTSVSVTVNGTTVAPVLYYTSPTQIDAVLPSNTPVGAGTLTVTYNNTTSASATILVTASGFGIDTLSGTGSGTIVATVGSSVITPTNSAAPNQTITIWGTGLGADPASSNYSTYPLTLDNLNNATVYIGGVQANVSYAGRSQYPGVDQINVTVPSSVGGCSLSVVVVANGRDSNFGSLPVNAGGGVCSDPELGITGSELEQIGSQGTIATGALLLEEITEPGVTALAKGFKPHQDQNLTTTYSAGAFFESTTGASYASSSSFYSLGSCYVSESTQTTTTVTGTTTTTGLDAGSPITLTGGGQNVQMTPISYGTTVLTGDYTATLATALLGGTAYTFTGPGGANVGPFTATITFPTPLTWSNEDSITAVTEAQGQQITWTGGATGTYVVISGSSTSNGLSGAEPVSASFTCLAPVSAGQFTVPAYVLQALPTGSGSLGVSNFALTGTFQATGLNYGITEAGVVSGENVNYQ